MSLNEATVSNTLTHYLKETESIWLYHGSAFDLAACIIHYLADTTTQHSNSNPGVIYHTGQAMTQ